jgi:glycerol-3-phosphate acyltransferase PlsY
MDGPGWFVWLVGCSAFAYIVGSVNLTILISRVFGIKGLQEAGSKNPGVTNLFRIAGAKAALPVLLLELAKAFLAFSPSHLLHASEIRPLLLIPFVLGNLFPIFHKFEGGKGVAAVVGGLLAVDSTIMFLGGAVFIGVFVLFRRVSLSSLSMALSYPAFIYVFHGKGLLINVAIVLAAILFFTHRSNIRRLVAGKEPPLKRNR